MKKLQELHKLAMDFAEIALLEKFKGNMLVWKEKTERAFNYECQAAHNIKDKLDFEPTRSVLLRSAASLAIELEKYREAEQLVSIGLSGNPPSEIANELRDLLEQINFLRHLDLRGISLQTDEFQMSIAGNGVGFGMAQSEEFIGRIQTIEKLVFRTAERKRNIPYREQASPPKNIRESFQLFVTVPRAASLAISVRLGRPKAQKDIQFDNEVETVVDEMINCLEMMNSKHKDQLHKNIPDKSYYDNFVSLAKKLAPSGKDVNLVGLTILRNGKQRNVAIKINQKDISDVFVDKHVSDQKPVNVIGRLSFADATNSESGKIKIIASNGDQHNVIVPKGMIDDIVKPLWDEIVCVSGTLKNGVIMLEDINKSESSE